MEVEQPATPENRRANVQAMPAQSPGAKPRSLQTLEVSPRKTVLAGFVDDVGSDSDSFVSGRVNQKRGSYRPERGTDIHHRMKYYYKLSSSPNTSAESSSLRGLLRPPDHILPDNLFSMLASKGKQSDLATIFSIVNTMMGATMLAIPWGFLQSGLVLGIAISFIIGALSFYTCSLVVKDNEEDGFFDYADLCEKYLGGWAKTCTLCVSILILLGAGSSMACILVSSMQSVISAIFTWTATSVSWWGPGPTGLIMASILFPLCLFKDVSIIVKISTLGVISLAYLIFFLFYQSFERLHLDFTDIDLVRGGWANLAGVQFLSYNIHNAIIPITRNQQNPQNTQQNLFVAYVLVFLGFTVPAVAWYLAYHKLDTPENPAPDNLLNNPDLFPDTNVMAFVVRFGLVLQLCATVPIIMYIIRVQFLSLLAYAPDQQTLGKIVPLTVALLGMFFSFAVFYPQIGTILRFTGASTGFIYVYFLPVCVHLLKRRKQGTLTIPATIGHIAIVAVGLFVFIAQFLTQPAAAPVPTPAPNSTLF